MVKINFFGFDSAWTDNPKKPGAICSIRFHDGVFGAFDSPVAATFGVALDLITRTHRQDELTLVGIDQPTIVPNLKGMRPVERCAASLVSWLGGGVQPSNRGKVGMFCDASPIWPFKQALGADDCAQRARSAAAGLFLIEVFPALALPSLYDAFTAARRLPSTPCEPG